MFLSEIYNQKWEIASNLEVNRIRVANTQRVEQEFHINIVAEGFDNPKEEEAVICCSIPKYISRLASNPSFKLRNVLISSGLQEGNDRVLQVMGVIYDTKLFTVRNRRKKVNLSDEERKARGLRLQNMRKVNQNGKRHGNGK